MGYLLIQDHILILSNFKKSIPLLFGFEFLNRFIIFLIFPILTHYLPKEEMGIYALLVLFFGLLSTIINPGINVGFLKIYSKDKKISILPSIIFISIWGAILSLIIILLSKKISFLLFNRHNLYLMIAFTTIWSITESIYILLHSKIRYDRKFILYGISLLIKTTTFLAIIFFFITRKEGVYGLIIGNIGGNITSSIILLLFASYKFTTKNGQLKNILKYGTGLAPALIFFLLLEYADRYILKIYTDLGNIGVYSIGYKIGGLIYYIYLVINKIWEPFIFSVNRDYNKIKKESPTLMVILGSSLFFLLLLRNTIYKLLIAQPYQEGKIITTIIGISYFLYGIFSIVSSPLYIKGRTHFISIIYGIGFVINLIIDLIIIPIYGITGAAISTLIAYFFLIIFSIIFDRDGLKTINYKILLLFAAIISIVLFFHI